MLRDERLPVRCDPISPPGHEREIVIPPLTSFDVCMSDEIDISCLFPSHPMSISLVMSMFRYVTSCVMCLCQLVVRERCMVPGVTSSLWENITLWSHPLLSSLIVITSFSLDLHEFSLILSLGWWWWCFKKGWEKGKLPSQRVKGIEIFHYRQTADSPSP